MLCVCIAYCVYVNVYHVSTQNSDERMINVHYLRDVLQLSSLSEIWNQK